MIHHSNKPQKQSLLIIIAVFGLFCGVCLNSNAQSYWKQSLMDDSVFVLKEKYGPINDTTCIVIIKDDNLTCESLNKLLKMKPSERDSSLVVLIAKGFRVEVYRKRELF